MILKEKIEDLNSRTYDPDAQKEAVDLKTSLRKKCLICRIIGGVMAGGGFVGFVILGMSFAGFPAVFVPWFLFALSFIPFGLSVNYDKLAKLLITAPAGNVRENVGGVDYKCHKCGTPISLGMNFCSKCGTKVRSSCPNCHHTNDSDSLFCENCGKKLDE